MGYIREPLNLSDLNIKDIEAVCDSYQRGCIWDHQKELNELSNLQRVSQCYHQSFLSPSLSQHVKN